MVKPYRIIIRDKDNIQKEVEVFEVVHDTIQSEFLAFDVNDPTVLRWYKRDTIVKIILV